MHGDIRFLCDQFTIQCKIETELRDKLTKKQIHKIMIITIFIQACYKVK